jgi:hypothetical protein
MTSAFFDKLRNRDAQIEMLKAVRASTVLIKTLIAEQPRAEAFL